MKKRILNKKKKKDVAFELDANADSGSEMDFKLMKKPKK